MCSKCHTPPLAVAKEQHHLGTTDRQNSNDFRPKKHKEIKHINGIHKPKTHTHTGLHKPTEDLHSIKATPADPYSSIVAPHSVVVIDPFPHPYSYTADPVQNALREAIVEQDIGPEGASWPPQISLRNGSNHGDLEWSKGGGVLQKCHRIYEKAKNL